MRKDNQKVNEGAASSRRTLLLGGMAGLASLLLYAAPATAFQRGTLTWSGTVEGVVRVKVRGNQVTVETGEGAAPPDASQRVSGSLPRQTLLLGITRLRGRGDVRVVQAPGPRNDYEAVVEIKDTFAGLLLVPSGLVPRQSRT
jgi:hypothetical protein